MNIKISHLSYTYAMNQPFQYEALTDINASIKSNDFIAIIGQTGSGKSTLIQNLNGLLIPTMGKVEVDEFVIQKKVKLKNIKQLRKKIGIVFQFPEYQLFEENVEKDILFGPKNFGFSEEQLNGLAKKSLEIVGLDETFLKKSPFELSGGEKRRVAIAGILAFDPEILIVDEPTAGLDPQTANKIMELFNHLHKVQKKTIILVTHQMDDVLKYANHVLADKLMQHLQVEAPILLKIAVEIKKKYPAFNISKVRDIDSFVQQLKDVI